MRTYAKEMASLGISGKPRVVRHKSVTEEHFVDTMILERVSFDSSREVAVALTLGLQEQLTDRDGVPFELIMLGTCGSDSLLVDIVGECAIELLVEGYVAFHGAAIRNIITRKNPDHPMSSIALFKCTNSRLNKSSGRRVLLYQVVACYGHEITTSVDGFDVAADGLVQSYEEGEGFLSRIDS